MRTVIPKFKQLLPYATAAFLVLLFLYTAIMKLKNPKVFHQALLKSPVLRQFADLLTLAVPVTELALVVLIIIPKTFRTGLLGSGFLMAAFTAYIGYMLVTNSKLPCSCGGILREMNWHEHFFFNLLITALSMLAY